MPIDWRTLELLCGVLLVIVASGVAGLRGVTGREKGWLGMLGLWGSRLFDRLNGQGERFVVAVFVCGAGVAAILIGRFIFQDYPYSGDEWSYLLQAEIFGRGRLHVESPPNPQFFDVWGMVNNGTFYAWAPPGWPLILMLGVLLAVPWLMNPLLGALTFLVVYRLGTRVYDRSVAWLALLFLLFSPFFLFHSASYFAHSSSLLFIALFVFFLARGIERKADRNFLWAGLCGSMSFLIRPFDQLAVFTPVGAYLLVLTLRRRMAVRQLVTFGMSHAVGLCLLLGYNYLQTGSLFMTGYQIGYDGPLFDYSFSGRQFIGEYGLHLLVWTFPFVPLLALLYSVWPGGARQKSPVERRWDALLSLLFLANVLGYAFVPFHYWVGYGPRYYYGSFFALVLLAARGSRALLDRLRRVWPAREWNGLAVIALGVCLTFSLAWLFPVKLVESYRNIDARRALYRLVAEEKIENAVVVIRAVGEDFLPWNLTRNPPDFEGPVLYVQDLGNSNHLLREQYPGREFFLYEYDETKPPILRKIARDTAMEVQR